LKQKAFKQRPKDFKIKALVVFIGRNPNSF
ncbi:unnamed protein product, partial [marine sediment metagenome]